MRRAIVALLAAIAFLACAPTLHTATGVVTSTDGPSVAQVERFSLRTDDGQVIDFDVGRLDVSDGGQPAAHLREHLVSGIPITVEYRIDDGRPVALRYADAGQGMAR